MMIFKRKSNSNCTGFTLIEVMLSIAILTIVLGAIFATVINTQNAYNQGMTELMSQENTNRVFNQISRLIRQSTVISVSTDGFTISLQEPVDHDGDGNVYNDSTWEIEYGAIWDGAQYLGAQCNIVLDPTDSTSEASLGVDLNGDTDMSDVFGSGQVQILYIDNAGTIRFTKIISGKKAVFTGDLDGNGTIDEKIFRYWDVANDCEGTGLEDKIAIKVHFMAMHVAPDGYPYIIETEAIIHPRNP